MWSYYADGHKGLCYEFDIPDNIYKEKQFNDVQYSNTRPTLTVKFQNTKYKPDTYSDTDTMKIENNKKNNNRIKDLYYHKSLQWKHE